MPRKEDRQPYLREVELEFASGKRTARISDISAGGCYIDTIAQAAVGEPITLQISASYGEAMRICGKVAYILEGFGFGVEFVDLTNTHREFLDRLVTAASG